MSRIHVIISFLSICCDRSCMTTTGFVSVCKQISLCYIYHDMWFMRILHHQCKKVTAEIDGYFTCVIELTSIRTPAWYLFNFFFVSHIFCGKPQMYDNRWWKQLCTEGLLPKECTLYQHVLLPYYRNNTFGKLAIIPKRPSISARNWSHFSQSIRSDNGTTRLIPPQFDELCPGNDML